MDGSINFVGMRKLHAIGEAGRSGVKENVQAAIKYAEGDSEAVEWAIRYGLSSGDSGVYKAFSAFLDVEVERKGEKGEYVQERIIERHKNIAIGILPPSPFKDEKEIRLRSARYLTSKKDSIPEKYYEKAQEIISDLERKTEEK